MTERGRSALQRDPGSVTIGPSALRMDGDTLLATIDERATPLPRRALGSVRLWPEARNDTAFDLDGAGRHWWRPPAPAARVEVSFERPRVSWSGHAYLDMNFGAEPLEAGFVEWNWSRSRLRDGRSAVFYEGTLRTGAPFALAVEFAADGTARAIGQPPPIAPLRRTNWLLPRRTRSDGGRARLVRTLEDTPFYTRSALATRLDGEPAETVHESVDLDRFASRWVQTLLPYRMPRRP